MDAGRVHFIMRASPRPNHDNGWWFVRPGEDGPNRSGNMPHDCTWCELMRWDGARVVAHYAYDFSGEYQPAFCGWFDEGLNFVCRDESKIMLFRELEPRFEVRATA